jgi:hypothetical protein
LALYPFWNDDILILGHASKIHSRESGFFSYGIKVVT